MPNTILTRMGDGERVKMSPSEIRDELRKGSEHAARTARISILTDDEFEQLYDIIAEPGRVVSVPHGHELIVTDDGIAECFGGSEADGGSGVSISRQSSVLSYERGLAADTASLGHADYSFKPVKAILDTELQDYQTISMLTTVPLFYGSQHNMGLYFQPDGPFPNPVDLMPEGKIREAQEAQEGAAEQLCSDMVYIGKELNAMGCEGFNFDTAGSTGDVDVMDLVDEDIMYPLRKELGIGRVTPEAGGPEGILAKCRVAELLNIEINSVKRFKSKVSQFLP